MRHRVYVQLPVDAEGQFLAVEPAVQLAGCLAAPDQIMNEFKIAGALVQVTHFRRQLARRRKGRRESDAHQLAVVLQEIKQRGQNLDQFVGQTAASLRRRLHQVESLVMREVHQRLIQFHFVGKVIIKRRLGHFRRFHNFLDRSSFITAIGELFQGRLQDVLTRGGIGGQHGLTGR